jgi:hypothetical protein
MTRLNFDDAIYLEGAEIHPTSDGDYLVRVKVFSEGYYEDFYSTIQPDKAGKLKKPLQIYEAVADEINDDIERWAWRVFWEQEIREDEEDWNY